MGVITQGASSLSNFLLTFSVGRLARPDDFGRFAVLYAGFAVVLGLVRSSLLETLLVAAGHREPGTDEHHDRMALLATVVVIGGLGSVAIIGSGLAFAPNAPDLVAALALAIPVVLVNDTARYLAIADGRTERALHSDVVWMVVMIVGAAALSTASVPTGAQSEPRVSAAAWAVIVWAIGAGAGLWANRRALGSCPRRPSRRRDRSGDPRPDRSISLARPAWPLSLDHLIMTGRGLLFMVTYATVFGPGAVAAVAMAALAFQPPATAVHGLRHFSLRRLTTVSTDHGGGGRGVETMMPAAVGLLAVTWAVAVAAVPDTVGVRLLGPSFSLLAAAWLPLAGFEILRLIELPLLDRFRTPARRAQLPLLRLTSMLAMVAVAVAMATGVIGTETVALESRLVAGLVGVAVIGWWTVIDRRPTEPLEPFAK
jgi:hypothetical protein